MEEAFPQRELQEDCPTRLHLGYGRLGNQFQRIHRLDPAENRRWWTHMELDLVYALMTHTPVLATWIIRSKTSPSRRKKRHSDSQWWIIRIALPTRLTGQETRLLLALPELYMFIISRGEDREVPSCVRVPVHRLPLLSFTRFYGDSKHSG